MSTYSHLKKYTGSRYADSQQLREVCEAWDQLPQKDAQLTTVAMFTQHVHSLSIGKIVTGNHFHMASAVPQRTFHALDGVIFDTFPNFEFREISPVQPIGLNRHVANLSQNKILSAVRSSEVNADITTALFRLAYKKFRNNMNSPVTTAGIARITRAQSYNPKTKFLPHFRMFGYVTIAKSGKKTIITENTLVLQHVLNNLKLSNVLRTQRNSPVSEVELELTDTRIIKALVESGKIDGEEIKRHTTDPEYDAFERFSVNLPKTLPLDDPSLEDTLKQIGCDTSAAELRIFYAKLCESMPLMKNKTYLRLNRIADSGYYNGLSFNIYMTNSDGLRLPIANGGGTDWASKVSGTPETLCIVSGIGEELIARYYFPPKETI